MIPAVGALLFLFVLAFIFRTAFSDPGILPRATADEVRYLERLTANDGAQSIALPGRVLDVQIVDGPVLRLKYCSTCKLFRPPRVSHCSICDACVGKTKKQRDAQWIFSSFFLSFS